jgi:hypothetical protein
VADGPLRPGFGLSGDVHNLADSVIPTGADHRDSGGLRSGNPALSGVEGDLDGWPILNFAFFAKFRVGTFRDEVQLPRLLKALQCPRHEESLQVGLKLRCDE